MAKHTCKGRGCTLIFPRGTNRNTRYCAQCRHKRDLELKRKTWHRHKGEYRLSCFGVANQVRQEHKKTFVHAKADILLAATKARD